MCLRVLGGDIWQAVDCLDEGIVEVYDDDLVVACIRHQVLLARLCDLLNFVEESPVFCLQDKVLKELEKEGSVEAATISAHPSHILVLCVEHIEAVLKLVGLVFFFKHAQILKVADVRHAIVDRLSDLRLELRVELVFSDAIINYFLGSFDLFLGHLRGAILLVVGSWLGLVLVSSLRLWVSVFHGFNHFSYSNSILN